MRGNVGEVVKGPVMEDFVSLLELRFYREIDLFNFWLP